MISRPSLDFLCQGSCLLDMQGSQKRKKRKKKHILSKSSVGISLNSKSKYKYEKYIILVIRIHYHVLKCFIICWTLPVPSSNPCKTLGGLYHYCHFLNTSILISAAEIQIKLLVRCHPANN